MSTLLLQIRGNRLFNKTLFPPYIFIYDDLISYRKRRLFRVKEIAISYNQVAQVNLTRGIIFATLEIMTTSADDIEIDFVPNKDAYKAKNIIEQKVHYAHRHKLGHETSDMAISQYEKSLSRLKELELSGKISKGEFEKRRKEMLKKWK